VFDKSMNDSKIVQLITEALQDYNIPIIPIDNFGTIPATPPTLWPLIDAAEQHDVKGYDLSMLANENTFLPFSVRYQLESCISHDILNEHNLTTEFVLRLARLSRDSEFKARSLLEYFSSQEKRIFDPMAIFEDAEALGFSPNERIPHYCALSRKATITPSTVYYSSPTVETSNRVIRHYSRWGDRFLRVQFTDEIAEVSSKLEL
jgi:RNA-dependent RNA polymerase